MTPLLKPYNLTPQQVADTLERALAGSVDCREWDTFISIPIKGNAAMESARAKCEALAGEESITANGAIQHSRQGRDGLQRILRDLHHSIQALGPLMAHHQAMLRG